MKPFKEADGYAGDLQAAYDYYKAYSLRAAAEFLDAYEQTLRIVQRHPFICRPRAHGWRQGPIRKHAAFSIFYREMPRFWLLGGIVSTVQDPDAIQARLLIRESSESGV